MSELIRVKTRCGTIIDGALTETEKKIHMIYCPTSCPCCGSPHGYETYKKISKLNPRTLQPISKFVNKVEAEKT